jgi:hypothetical protein
MAGARRVLRILCVVIFRNGAMVGAIFKMIQINIKGLPRVLAQMVILPMKV